MPPIMAGASRQACATAFSACYAENSIPNRRRQPSRRLRLAVHNDIFKLEICDTGSRELVLARRKHYIDILQENVADLRLARVWPDRAEGPKVTLDADEVH